MAGKNGLRKMPVGDGPTRGILCRYTPAEKKEGESVICAKRKAAAGGPSERGDAAAPAADTTAAAAAGGGGEDATPKIKFVEMPKEFLSWILSQERERGPLTYDPTKSTILSPEQIERQRELISKMNASLQETEDMEDEFFEFQAWVRDKFKKNGRVMVPEDFLP